MAKRDTVVRMHAYLSVQRKLAALGFGQRMTGGDGLNAYLLYQAIGVASVGVGKMRAPG